MKIVADDVPVQKLCRRPTQTGPSFIGACGAQLVWPWFGNGIRRTFGYTLSYLRKHQDSKGPKSQQARRRLKRPAWANWPNMRALPGPRETPCGSSLQALQPNHLGGLEWVPYLFFVVGKGTACAPLCKTGISYVYLSNICCQL